MRDGTWRDEGHRRNYCRLFVKKQVSIFTFLFSSVKVESIIVKISKYRLCDYVKVESNICKKANIVYEGIKCHNYYVI